VQRLQFFLPQSVRGPGPVNARRLELLLADPLTAPHGGGVLVIDDESGDRKDGSQATALCIPHKPCIQPETMPVSPHRHQQLKVVKPR
jgi:hypothetical protein